jgi:hypothetical protein
VKRYFNGNKGRPSPGRKSQPLKHLVFQQPPLLDAKKIRPQRAHWTSIRRTSLGTQLIEDATGRIDQKLSIPSSVRLRLAYTGMDKKQTRT